MTFHGLDRCNPSRSSHDFADHISRDVGQSEISAGVAVGQLLVVEAHQRQQRGMEIGRMHSAFDGVDVRTRRWPHMKSPA